jgi:two-component system response regulator NreC
VVGDDHSLVRRGLRLLLEREAGVEIVAEAGDIADAIRHARGHRPHVLILDLTMPSGSSLKAIAALREQAPGTEVVVLGMDDDPAYARRALPARSATCSRTSRTRTCRRRSAARRAASSSSAAT